MINMTGAEDKQIISDYKAYVDKKTFACIAAKAALAKQQIKCMLAGHLACPKDDEDILQFIYDFINDYRNSEDLYHSAAVIFKGPEKSNEALFDEFMWQRLQALSDKDATRFNYDSRVDKDPNGSNFSFSLGGEAFYIIGLHSGSSRLTRQFSYPTLVFNPHAQFEQLRQTQKYDNMKAAVRKRDVAYSGSVNPMLKDFGTGSEVFQYSGREYDASWECPLKINHAGVTNYSAS